MLLSLSFKFSDAQVNLSQGLVAYYPFNGNTNDASGNGNNAVNNGATLTTDQWGNSNSAYLFNGTSNYMSVANNATLQLTSVTLCARVKPNAFYPGLCYNNSIFDRGNGGFNPGSFSLVYTPTLNQNPQNYCITPDTLFQNYRINVNISATPSLNCITPANAIPYVTTNQWDCVIGVYDNSTSTGSIYVNGVFRYSYTYPAGMGGINNNTLYIGGTTNPTYPYYVNGVLDELRIYNRALNMQEIDSLCNYNPNPVLPDTVVAEYSYNYPNTCDSTLIQFSDLSYAINSNIVSWNWNFGDGNTSILQNPLHDYLNAGTYTVTLITTNNLSHSDTFALTVTVIENALSITANAAPAVLCYGNSTVLSGNGSVSYIWTGGVNNGVAFSPLGSGTYTVTGTDANGCTATSAVTVTVNPLPLVIANAAPLAVCPGGQSTLSGTGGISYVWSGGAVNGVAFTPLVTNTYTVTGTDANGCTNSSSVTITVNAVPNIMANANPSMVCSGSSTTLYGSGGVSYLWSGGVLNGNAFIPAANANYTVTGTDANGCSNTSAVNITVVSPPNISGNAQPAMLCAGSQTTLNGSGGVSYTWSGGVINANPFTPQVSGIYTVTGADANACTATATVLITVNPLPNILASANPAAVCPGNTTTLNGSGGITYSWSGGIVNGVPFVPLPNTNYTVTGTDANGCTNTSAISIALNPPILVQISPDHPQLCAGDTVHLTATGGLTYSWANIAGLDQYTGAQVSAFPAVTSTYTVNATDVNGCTGSTTIVINVSDNIDVAATKTSNAECEQNMIQLTAQGAQKYEWKPANLLSNAHASTTNAYIVQTTTFYVTGTSGYCTNTDSITVNYYNNDETGIIIPNAFSPNGDGLNDCLKVLHAANFKNFFFTIYNRWGEKVFETKDPGACWNGTYKELPAPSDTYYYYLKAESICGKLFKKGDITIIR
jgi:gliding motility-associated-like protein